MAIESALKYVGSVFEHSPEIITRESALKLRPIEFILTLNHTLHNASLSYETIYLRQLC